MNEYQELVSKHYRKITRSSEKTLKKLKVCEL